MKENKIDEKTRDVLHEAFRRSKIIRLKEFNKHWTRFAYNNNKVKGKRSNKKTSEVLGVTHKNFKNRLD